MRMMNPIPNEEDFNEVECKINELLEETDNFEEDTVKYLLKEFASWAIDQVIPDPAETYPTQGTMVSIHKGEGFNACREQSLQTKRDMGL